MELQIIRTYHDKGTNGELLVDGKRLCFTIELPWKKNERRVSCIPEGRYTIRRRYTKKFGWHFWVENVPGRDAILLHTFNDALKESKGCIAPVTIINGPGRGVFSRRVLDQLLALAEPVLNAHKPIFLIIKNAEDENNS